jgi:hypothetical protein
VIAMFARASDLLMALPFKDIQGNAYQYNREGALPGVAFRGVNESYTASTGMVNQLVEALRIAGGDLDVDTFIICDAGRGRPRHARGDEGQGARRRAHARAHQGRLHHEPARVRRAPEPHHRGSSSTPARRPAATRSRSQILDQLIDAVPGCNALLMSKAMRRLLTTAARNYQVGGFITYDKDAFGRRVTVYNDIPILVPYSDNGGTEPIAFDEACPGGGSAVGTSIYPLAFGDGLVSGIQSGPMQVRDLGELETTPAKRTRVEWDAGLCIEHGRAAARLRGIKNAAVVA